MGQIDVSDILSDPDFVQPLTLIQRKPCVDNYGNNQLKEIAFPVVGSVQPISGKALSRLPEAFRVANVQSFWVRQQLLSDTRNQYPDIIIKNGVRFTVQTTFDWTDWGHGWTEGTCVQEKPTL